MSIGLSRNARLLLAQLVEVHRHGERNGLAGDQLSFTLSENRDRAMIQFVADHPPLETRDPNAIWVLRANHLIEQFTTIRKTSNVPRYVVTKAGLNVASHTAKQGEQDALTVRGAEVDTSQEANNRELVPSQRAKTHG